MTLLGRAHAWSAVVARARSSIRSAPGSLRSPSGARAQSTVELALVLPVFLLMLLGVVDLGRAFFQYVELVNGVREGARVASITPTNAAIKQAVITRTTLGLTASDITISCYSPFTSSSPIVNCSDSQLGALAIGDGVKVEARKSFQPITGQIIAIVGSSIVLQADAMRSIQ